MVLVDIYTSKKVFIGIFGSTPLRYRPTTQEQYNY